MSFLQDKRVLITGGSNGIGEATAHRFARQGARVLIAGSRQASVDEALARADGKLAGGVACDLSSMAGIDTLVEAAKAQLGQVDIYFANAGIAHFLPLAEMTEDLFDDIMAVNVKSLYFSIQKLVPLMPQGSVIVATGSIAPRKGQTGVAAYGGSKGAVRGMVRNLAAELLEMGIRINCLAPGPVKTNIFTRMTGGDEAAAQAVLDRISASVPLGRVGTPEEIAEAVEFMCGPGSAYMVGAEITLDGGKAEL
ncbi:MAG: SDR family NAD(P)-dependent oxidoreductase [Burkholderiaceae bacterium]